ncbi:hypothetical protein NC652_032909 [Populus alba x Populus x berolinensis]|nr:hypothetical protein NC652_032909 [Populus alba x Populus x berolinensis]
MSHGGYRRQALQLSFTALHQPCADESFVSRFTQQKLVALGDVEARMLIEGDDKSLTQNIFTNTKDTRVLACMQ